MNSLIVPQEASRRVLRAVWNIHSLDLVAALTYWPNLANLRFTSSKNKTEDRIILLSIGANCDPVVDKGSVSNIDMTMDEELIRSESKNQYKLRLEKHITIYILNELKKQQKEHNKIIQICYNRLETQTYLKTHMLNNMKYYHCSH